jgi:hypothetical protein
MAGSTSRYAICFPGLAQLLAHWSKKPRVRTALTAATCRSTDGSALAECSSRWAGHACRSVVSGRKELQPLANSLHGRVDIDPSRAGQRIEGGARAAVSRFEVVAIERYQRAAGLENRLRFLG